MTVFQQPQRRPRMLSQVHDSAVRDPDLDLTGLDFEAIVEQFAEQDDRGLLFIGQGRRVLAMNRAACELFGVPERLPLPIGEVVHDVNIQFAVGDVFHDRRDGRHEVFLPDPDRLLLVHLVPILRDSGEVSLVVATVEDVTQLRHLETVRRDFVANVSHELRTPLASINLLVETLQMGGMEDPQAAEHFLHRIEVETQAMSRLVEELLELSRLESGTLSLSLEPVVVADLMGEVVNRLEPTASDKGVEVRVDVADPALAVVADPKRLEQILLNLTHNAIKFTSAGGLVTLRAARQGRGVTLEVVDTGVGMDAEEASRVFERFYKVDRGRNRAAGSGLGLAVSRHLVELHGSQIHVVSEPGRGSRFSFALPVN